MSDIQAQRRFFAEEIQVVANLTTAALVDALARVAREQFLPAGPWTIRGEGDFQAPPRQTADADPRHVCHNVAVAIDPARMLFNGAPGLIAMAIDSLRLTPGARVLHIGTGLGYYTALMANCVGPAGRVLGIEVDADLAASARSNLSAQPWVEIRHGDGAAAFDEMFDAVLVNAGVTHPLAGWLEALAPGGRMIVPITATMGPMLAIGKGPLVLVTRAEAAPAFDARIAGFVAIYSAIGLRDDAANLAIGEALRKNPFAPIKSLRRDTHEPTATCWIHTPHGCLSLEAASSASS